MPIVLRRRVTVRYRIMCFAAALVLTALFAVFAVFAPAGNGLLNQAGPACALLALLALYHAAFRPDLKWTLDNETVACTRTTVFGARCRQWPMAHVTGIRVRTIDGDEWRDTYYVELRLTSGKRLRLPPYRRQGRADEIALEIEALQKDRAS